MAGGSTAATGAATTVWVGGAAAGISGAGAGASSAAGGVAAAGAVTVAASTATGVASTTGSAGDSFTFVVAVLFSRRLRTRTLAGASTVFLVNFLRIRVTPSSGMRLSSLRTSNPAFFKAAVSMSGATSSSLARSWRLSAMRRFLRWCGSAPFPPPG